jgi:hypothetical protein
MASIFSTKVPKPYVEEKAIYFNSDPEKTG